MYLAGVLPATETACDADEAAHHSNKDVRRRHQPECVAVQDWVTEVGARGVSREFAD